MRRKKEQKNHSNSLGYCTENAQREVKKKKKKKEKKRKETGERKISGRRGSGHGLHGGDH